MPLKQLSKCQLFWLRYFRYGPCPGRRLLAVLILLLPMGAAHAAETLGVVGIPIEYILFALTLSGIALFHNQTFYVALAGLTSIFLYKIVFTGFKTGIGMAGLVAHFADEWVVLVNLFALLMGFVILARPSKKAMFR